MVLLRKTYLLYLLATCVLVVPVHAQEAGLVGHWIFDSEHMDGHIVGDNVGEHDITLEGPVRLVRNEVTEALELDGISNALLITDDISTVRLPSREITVEAWVRYVNPFSWGGFIGAFQDSGSYEMGWVLGYRGSRVTFALASTDADQDGDGVMTYMDAPTPVELGGWYHVAGTYDGSVMKIYVNGQLENRTTEQSGDILYPPNAFYEIGAYRDDDEYYRLKGSLKEVRLYDRVLSADEIANRFRAYQPLAALEVRKEKPQIVVGPYLQYATQHSITVLWETNREATTRVEYGLEVPLTERFVIDGQRRLHEVILNGLTPQTNYFYRVVSVMEDGVELASDISTFQTAVEDETAFAFAVIGDTQNNPPVWERISEGIWRERPNFVVLCGDIVGTGSNTYEWVHEFFAPAAPLMKRMPIYTVLGNHEGDADNYYKYMANPAPEYFYTFTYGNAQFFMIDSNRDLTPGSEQFTWLESALAQSTATWKFAAHHHPPYTSDENDYGDTYQGPALEGDPRVQPAISLYEQYGVDIVFFGHIHDYERTWPIKEGKVNQEEGVLYIQTGGAGGSLENFAPTRSWFTARVRRDHHFGLVLVHEGTLQFNAIDLDGRLFDQIEIRKTE